MKNSMSYQNYIEVYEEFYVLSKLYRSLWKIICLIKIIYRFMKNSMSLLSKQSDQ